jgi:hypothetical protein
MVSFLTAPVCFKPACIRPLDKVRKGAQSSSGMCLLDTARSTFKHSLLSAPKQSLLASPIWRLASTPKPVAALPGPAHMKHATA